MRVIAAMECGAQGCPTIYAAENDEVVVQGYIEHITTPEGESAVRLPANLLSEAVKNLRAE